MILRDFGQVNAFLLFVRPIRAYADQRYPAGMTRRMCYSARQRPNRASGPTSTGRSEHAIAAAPYNPISRILKDLPSSPPPGGSHAGAFPCGISPPIGRSLSLVQPCSLVGSAGTPADHFPVARRPDPTVTPDIKGLDAEAIEAAFGK
jgi:hypothetical protein